MILAERFAELLREGRPLVEAYDEHSYDGQRWMSWMVARDALATWLTYESPDTFDHFAFIDSTER